MIVHRPGRIDWQAAFALQSAARERVAGGSEDEIFLLEHRPVVTLGKRGGQVDEDALSRLATPVLQTDRGGLATWHGPGQLVGYPIVDIARRGLSVPSLVRWLGEAMAAVAHALDVPGATFDPDNPGVYVGGRKLGSIGLHIQRGVTTHGFALNVCNSLEGFAAITPCGVSGQQMTTLTLERGVPTRVDEVAERMLGLLQS